MKAVLSWLARHFWLVVALLLLAGVLFFTFTGNDAILPAIYH